MAGQNIAKTMELFQAGNQIKSNFTKKSSIDKGFKNILDNNSNSPDKNDNMIENEKLNSSKSRDKVLVTEPKQREQIKNVNSNQTQNKPLVSKETSQLEEPVTDDYIGELENKVKSSVLEVLNISEEELEIVMSELGIGLLDLLKQDNLKDLVLKVNGKDDMLELVTNSNMTNQLNQLFGEVKNIKAEFNVDDKNISDLIKGQTNLNQSQINLSGENAVEGNIENISDNSTKKPQDTILNEEFEILETKQPEPVIVNEVKKESTSEINISDKDFSKEIVNKDISKEYNLSEDSDVIINNVNQQEEAISEEKIVDVNQQHILPKEVNRTNDAVKGIHNEDLIVDDESIKTTEVKPKEITIEVSTDGLKESNSNNGSNLSESNQESHDNGLNTFVNNLVQNVTNDKENVDLSQVKQFREIINQIVEQIKISVKPDTSSMEIQLNPESLGKINLQVVAKDGVLSAQFTAQTQIAKEAIESQIVSLKENLNNQGLKVEAIEVTIASSGFDQSQANSSNQGESKQPKRKLTMEQISALMGEDLSEEEKIAIDIMRQNGSSIDYTA